MLDATKTAPPNNIEAERSVLGAILLDNTALDQLPSGFGSEHFYDPVHAEIFRLTRERVAEGRGATPVTIRDLMVNHEGLQKLGGPTYLGLLVDCAVLEWTKDHAETVVEMAQRRRLIELLADAGDLARAAEADVPGTIASIEADLSLIIDQPAAGIRSFLEATVSRADEVGEAFQKGAAPLAVPTGLKDVDAALCGGFAPEELIILAGRPSMGKSALAACMAVSAARERHGVLIVSREMSDRQWIDRAVSMRASERGSRIPYKLLKQPHLLEQSDVEEWMRSANDIGHLPVLFASSSTATPSAIAAETRRAVRRFDQAETPLALVVVDYLQLIRGDHRSESRNIEVAAITGELKDLAKQTGVAVMALSQLSRDVERRGDKRPGMADLRDSGGIEQDADIVMLMFREEYYLRRQEPRSGSPEWAEWRSKLDEARNLVEIIIDKNRAGEVGVVQAHCDLAVNKISDLRRAA